MSADLQPMAVARGSLEAYAEAAGDEAIERVRAAAEPLRGARILHISGASSAPRVPDLLGSLLPLAADAGVEVGWRVLFGGDDLSGVAAALTDGLQGAETAVDDGEWDAYLESCADAAAEIDGRWDAIVLHDPGTLGLAPALAAGPGIWRCWVDASAPDPPLLERAAPLAAACAAVAYPDESFAPRVPGGPTVHSAAPGIDPLTPRNLAPENGLPSRLLPPLGLDLKRPFVLQVMRLDRWKDPHATLEAFALARDEVPGLQLVLAAAIEPGDEAEWRAAKEVRDYAGDLEDFHLLTSYEGVTSLELGALQRLARVALHQSLREGFGLAASEALWKGTPVVGNPDGGIPLQVRDAVDGFIAGGVEQTAARIAELVRDPGLAIQLGRSGREHVRERFLVTRALEDELRLLAAAIGG